MENKLRQILEAKMTVFKRTLIILIIFLCSVHFAFALVAFPGAEGFGAATRGAYGKSGTTPIVIKVTNLNSSGTGSFRTALQNSSPRIIIFTVGGTINLGGSDIQITSPYVTVAGQTAPGGGICIRNGALRPGTHNVIIRGIRWRGGRPGGDSQNYDCISIENQSTQPYNIIVDHCSLSWGSDEVAVTWYACHNITWSWNMITEGLNSGDHAYGLLAGNNSTKISIHHNLFAHQKMRMPECNGGSNGEIVNNIMYHWSSHATDFTDSTDFGGRQKQMWNVIGNYYKQKSSEGEKDGIKLFVQPGGWNGQYYLTTDSKFYIKGNVDPRRPVSTSGDEWSCVALVTNSNTIPYNSSFSQYRSETPVVVPASAEAITSTTAEYAYDVVLSKVGALAPSHDIRDLRMINDVKNGTGNIINTVAESDYPVLASGSAPADSDSDGMPNDFEDNYSPFTTTGLSPHTTSPSGYTWIEEYINGCFPGSIFASATPDNITADGASSAVIRAEVRNECDSLVTSNVPITFTITGVGTFGGSKTYNVNAVSGVANATLTSTESGISTITVTSANMKSYTIYVPVSSYALECSANPASITANGTSKSTITATIKDKSGTVFDTNLPVTFTISGPGSLPTAPYVVNANHGVATAEMTSTTTEGTAIVTASFPGAISVPVNINTIYVGPSAVADWHFDEGSGTTANDVSGNNNTGALSNGPTWVAGRVGNNALRFDGVDDYITVPNSSSLNIRNAISVEAWINTEEATTDAQTTRRIVEKGAYALGASDKAYFKLYIGGSAYELIRTWNTSDTNIWHHLVGTYDSAAGANNMRLYINGALIESATQSGTIDSNTGALFIGQKAANIGRFKGRIDEVKIFNRALTAGEVLTHYQNVSQPADTTAPATINNLNISNIGLSSMTLTWTSVGDDGTTGTAASYDIRYASFSITLGNWTNATTCTGEPTPKAAGGSETFTVNGLTTDTTYYFAIKTADEVPNLSLISNSPSGKTNTPPQADTTAPAAINTLATTNLQQTAIRLTWTSVGDDGTTGTAAIYDIRYATYTITSNNWSNATTCTGEPTPQASGNSETLTVNNLTADTTYYFAMKIADEVPNTSALSNVVSGKTAVIPPQPDTTAPAIINTLATTNLQQTAITLTWTSVGDDGTTGTATGYDIRYATYNITSSNWTNATTCTGEPTPQVSGNSETLTVSNLTVNTTYYFAMKASDEVPNTSALSNVANGKTATIPTDTTAPAAINTLTTGSLTTNSITLTWTSVGDDGTTGTATNYDVRYLAGTQITEANWSSANQATGEPTPRASGNTETLTISNLTANTTYYFAIKATDEIPNTSALSNVANGKTLPTPDTTPPSTVNDLETKNASMASLTLTWTSVGDDGIIGTASSYDIRYRAGTPITSSNWNTATQCTNEPVPASSGNTENFVVNGLTANTIYYFAMKSADELNNASGISNTASGQTSALPDTTSPATINTLTASNITSVSVTLNWSSVGDDGTTGTAVTYDIRYMAGTPLTSSNWNSAAQCDNEPTPQIKGNSETLTVSNLNPNTTYYFGIKVCDEVPNWSGTSNVVSGKTLVVGNDPPTVSNIMQYDINNITIDWGGWINTQRVKTVFTVTDPNANNTLQYNIQFSMTANFSNNYINSEIPSSASLTNGQTTNYITSNLAEGRWYWRVRAKDNTGLYGLFGNGSVIGNKNFGIDISAPIGSIADAEIYITSCAVSITASDSLSGLNTSPYKIRYSTSSNFDASITTTIDWFNETTKEIASLQSNTTYYIQLKARDEVSNENNWSASYVIKTSVVNNSTPTPGISLVPPVSFLTIDKVEGAKLQLSWLGSSSAEVVAYNIYMSTGAMDYSLPSFVTSSTQTEILISNLTADQEYKFVVRALDSNGDEEKNIFIMADTAVEHIVNGMGRVRVPRNGMDLNGKKITLISESLNEDVSNIRDVTFEYKVSSDTVWIAVPAANTNHPNPDTDYPYFINWDVSGLSGSYKYNVRAVVTDKNGNRDTRTGYVTIGIDDETPDIDESSNYKRERIDNRSENEILMGEPNIDQICKVTIPEGVLTSISTMLKIIINPIITQSISKNMELVNGSNLMLVGYIHDILVEDGQRTFTKELEISLPYLDKDNDNRVDGTNIGTNKLIICSFDGTIGKWEKITNSTVDKTKKTVICRTKHLSYYGVFMVLSGDLSVAHVYPNPFKPSLGHTKIFFTNLTNHTKIKIFNVSGELVYEDEKDTPQGELSWDVKNNNAKEIGSGVYIYMITNNNGQTKKGKLAIIR